MSQGKKKILSWYNMSQGQKNLILLQSVAMSKTVSSYKMPQRQKILSCYKTLRCQKSYCYKTSRCQKSYPLNNLSQLEDIDTSFQWSRAEGCLPGRSY